MIRKNKFFSFVKNNFLSYTFYFTSKGGFGTVYLAKHILTGEYVAIKVIDKIVQKKEMPRIYREIKALKDLNHSFIYQIYQVIENDNFVIMVLEYCSSGELFDYIIEKNYLSEDEARTIFYQLAIAIENVHYSGYVHRDLKPENIMLSAKGHIKLIDFGLCANPRGNRCFNDRRIIF